MPGPEEKGHATPSAGENPYAAPAPAELAAVRGGAPGAPRFDGRRGLSRLITWLILASAVVTVVSVTTISLMFLVLTSAEDQSAVNSAWTHINPVTRGIAFLSTALLLASGISFAIWFKRKHANLPALGAADLAHTPGWAGASFFVPIANLYLPHRIGVEIWRASNPRLSLTDPTAWKREGSHGLVSWWWGLFLGVRLGEPLVGHIFGDSQDPDHYLILLGFLLFLQVAWIGAALVTLSFVRRLDARQEARYERLAGEGRRLFDPAADPLGPAVGSAPAQAWPKGPHCPRCHALYRMEDYRAEAEHIYCSHCHEELPRAGETPRGAG